MPGPAYHARTHLPDGTDPIAGITIDGIRFDTDNQGGYLDVQTNDSDGGGYGFHFNDQSGVNGTLWEVEQSFRAQTDDGLIGILIRDAFSGLTLFSSGRVFIDAASFEIAASTTIDGGANVAENFADGVAADDLATVGQLPVVPPPVQTREKLSGDPVTIANTALGELTWDTKVSGSDLLDLTTPSAPEVVDDGVYAVTVYVYPTALTAGGTYIVNLILDSGGEDGETSASSPPSVASNDAPNVSLSVTHFIPAGGVIHIQVVNQSGASEDFALGYAIVQRLS